MGTASTEKLAAEQPGSPDETINALKRGRELTDMFNKLAELFLSRSDIAFEAMMTDGLKLLSGLLDIDRFSIFRSFTLTGEVYASQIYRWERASGGATEPNSAFATVTFAQLVPTWDETFSNRIAVNTPVRLMPEREAATLNAVGAVSVFAAPVHIDNMFWGFSLFEDHRNERVFDEDLAGLMRSAALLFTNAFIRAKTKSELTAEKNLFRAMVDAAPIGLNIWDENYNLIDCNITNIEIFGTDKQYYIDHFYEFSPECQPDGANSAVKAEESLRRAFNGEKLVLDWMHRSLSGEQIPCELTVTRVRCDEGYIVLVYIYDLRNIRKLEKAADEAAMTHLLIDAVPLSCTVTDRSFTILTCNKLTVDLFGAAGEEEVLNRFYDFSPEYQPDGRPSREASIEIIRQVYDSGRAVVEWVYQNKAGRLIPCEITFERIQYKGDYIVAGYARDLRVEKAMLDKIHDDRNKFKEMAHWYESLLDALPFLVTSQNWDEKFTFINKAAENIFGKGRHEIIGEPCHTLGLSICNTDNCAIACAKRGQAQTHFTHKDLSYQADVKILKDSGGRADGYIEVIQDITRLENMARQQAEAEAASRAKSSFLATMSHEMRTPMNAIIGMTSIGKNAADIDRKDYALNKIEDATKHLLGIINDVLDISKIEADKLELSPIEFNFDKMLHKIVSFINFRMDEKQQRFTLDIDKDIPYFVIGDDQRLTQVITNLLANAVKFTPEHGSIGLEAALVREEAGICTLQITVSDNGIGISPEHKARLFGRFEQAERGTRREYGGTGLGLSISKSIIELMDGEIWIESELGKGSRFIFTLKVKRGKKDIRSLLALGVKWDAMRVLVVDREPEVRGHFKSVFDQIGARCDTAADIPEAFRAIENGPCNLYFIDGHMPGMDRLAGKIRPGNKDWPAIVLMVSESDWALTQNMALDAGVSKYILKPVFSSEIIDCANEYLGLGGDIGDESSKTARDGRLSGKRLLVAEDVEINREIIISLLENTGMTIDCARNGLEAVEMIAAAPGGYDAVFMDVQMPKMDGIEATRRIRELTAQNQKHLPIIAMTANVFKSDVEAYLLAGMNDHIGKPIDIDDVFEKLYKYL